MQNGIVLVVSVSIFSADRILMIKENKPTAKNKWNFPGGRIEYGEDILFAAAREVKEETGLDVKLKGTTGIYNFFSSTNNQVILFHFTGEVIGGSINLEQHEISDSMWIRLKDLLIIENEHLREPKILEQIIGNLDKDNVYPIGLYNGTLENRT